MSSEHRRKNRHDRSPPQPHHPIPEPYDSGDDQTYSGEYTDRSDRFAVRYFEMPTRRMYENFINLQKKTFQNTAMIHLDTLHSFGVEDDFVLLTARVGFGTDFWSIRQQAYEIDTKEFLSSLELKRDNQDVPFIKFRLCNRTHRVYFSSLREWFGFNRNPTSDTISFREGWDRDTFWTMITGCPRSASSEYRARFIPHPTLRILQRALASTIFARGETLNRANTIDLMLMDTMLRPDPEYPDLALLMVNHWIQQRDNKKSGGKIKIGSYVELIKQKIGLGAIPGREPCKGPTIMDADSYRQGLFLSISRGPAGHQDFYDWHFENGASRRLPFGPSILPHDTSTWLITVPPPPASDIPSSSTQTPPSQSARPHLADPSLRDLYSLMTDIRDTQVEQGRHIRAIQEDTALHSERLDELSGHMFDYAQRLGDIEDQFRDWRFDPSYDY